MTKEIRLEPNYLVKGSGDLKRLKKDLATLCKNLTVKSSIDKECDTLSILVYYHQDLVVMPVKGKITAFHSRDGCSFITDRIVPDFAHFKTDNPDDKNSGCTDYKVYYEFNERELMDYFDQ